MLLCCDYATDIEIFCLHSEQSGRVEMFTSRLLWSFLAQFLNFNNSAINNGLPIKFQFTTLTALCSIVFEKIKYNKKSKNEASYGPYREWIFNNVATILRPLNFQSLCMKKKFIRKEFFFRGNKQTTRKIQEWAENCVADVCGSGVVK